MAWLEKIKDKIFKVKQNLKFLKNWMPQNFPAIQYLVTRLDYKHYRKLLKLSCDFNNKIKCNNLLYHISWIKTPTIVRFRLYYPSSNHQSKTWDLDQSVCGACLMFTTFPCYIWMYTSVHLVVSLEWGICIWLMYTNKFLSSEVWKC